MLVCKSWNVLLNETQIDQKLVQYNGFLRVLLLRVHLNLIYLLILNGEKLNDPTVAAMYMVGTMGEFAVSIFLSSMQKKP